MNYEPKNNVLKGQLVVRGIFEIGHLVHRARVRGGRRARALQKGAYQ